MDTQDNTLIIPLSRRDMASRIASDIEGGWYVNLGIGIPTLIADVLPADREIVIHSENGVLGMGPAPAGEAIDPWLVNAGKGYVTLLPGGAFIHQADSFVVVRGGHLDLCVLGAFEVACNGDIANWATSLGKTAPAVGGAMDLAAGAKRLWVAMEHETRNGQSRLVERCNLPLTAKGVVDRIYTNLALIEIRETGFCVLEMVAGLTPESLQDRTAAKLDFTSLRKDQPYGPATSLGPKG
ncbi:3-oxoacid CoA-transferase subunit B [Mesorhizobium sp. 1B3]|uniref:3-oxoacid CoA-transferase subunit B n=1 Tax=Mesorhizobium sp. 1B3 TaxID=3243599 RepID=UPI003D9A027A